MANEESPREGRREVPPERAPEAPPPSVREWLRAKIYERFGVAGLIVLAGLSSSVVGVLWVLDHPDHWISQRICQLTGLCGDDEEPDSELQAMIEDADAAYQAGNPRLARDKLNQALFRTNASGDTRGRAEVLVVLGEIERLQDRTREARANLTEAIRLYERLGERHGEAAAWVRMGMLERMEGEPRAARTAFEHGLRLYRDPDDPHGQADALAGLGSVEADDSRLEAAEAKFREALGLYREAGHRLGEANMIQELGGLLSVRGEYEAAREELDAAGAIYEEIGDRYGAANLLLRRADLEVRAGDLVAARRAGERALEHYAEDELVGRANVLLALADIELADLDPSDPAYTQRRAQAARTSMELALDAYRRADHPRGEGNAHLALAQLSFGGGDLDDAEERVKRALVRYEDEGFGYGVAQARKLEGDIELARDEPRAALDRYRDAARAAESAQARAPRAYALRRTGEAWNRLGEPTKAREALEEARDLYEALSDPRHVSECERLLGDAAVLAGDPAEADEHYERATRPTAPPAAPGWFGEVWLARAVNAHRSGLPGADRFYERSFLAFEEAGEPRGQGRALRGRAIFSEDVDPRRALVLYRRAERIFAQAGYLEERDEVRSDIAALPRPAEP